MKSELLKRILSTFVLLPLVIFIVFQETFILNLFILICFFVSSFEWYKMTIKKNYFYSGIIFLIFSFFTVYKLSNTGIYYSYFIFVLLICISTDIGGYIFGKLFKGPKLTSISPKKTFAGLFGGLSLSIVSVLLLLKIDYLFQDKIEISFKLMTLTVLISSVSQLGDIVISYFKRLSNIKDTGNIIPGHGGLLDRIDGMIFAFPFLYIILSINFFKIL